MKYTIQLLGYPHDYGNLHITILIHFNQIFWIIPMLLPIINPLHPIIIVYIIPLLYILEYVMNYYPLYIIVGLSVVFHYMTLLKPLFMM